MENKNAGPIAIYARVSTARQEEDGTIETQLTALRDHAAKSGYSICKEYIDDGWSGDILARPSLDELRQDARKKIWCSVLVYDPDRIARRYSYQELVMDELREAGVELMFLTVSAPKNSEEKILHGVRGLFAEYERAKIAERFRLGKVRKVKEGHVLVSEAPYGYAYVPKRDGQHGYYKVNPEEARVVGMIFQWVGDSGYTTRKVVRELELRGIKPRKSARGVWSTSTIGAMLRNKTYIGIAHWGRSYAVAPDTPIKKGKYRKLRKSSRRLRSEEEWFKIPVPAIIDQPQFIRAGEQLERNFALSERKKKNEYLLAGKIRCICGRSRTGEGPKNGKYLYYRCADRVLSYPLPATCKEKGVNARIADELVWKTIAELMSSERLLAEQIRVWLQRRQGMLEVKSEDTNALQNQISMLEARERRYSDAYSAGLFTLAQLREYLSPIREKIASFRGELSLVTNSAAIDQIDQTPTEEEIREFSAAARRMLRDLDFGARRGIVLNAVEKIVATPQKLTVSGSIPINQYVEKRPIHRHGQGANRQSTSIHFEFDIALPAPLRRGVDYGFVPGSNVSRAAA